NSWLSWYNSASYNETTYDNNMIWCTTTGTNCVPIATEGKQQVDTPQELLASVLAYTAGGFEASLSGKYTGQRYYTYTNDQGFDPVTTFDLGLSYDFAQAMGREHGVRLSLNITNLTDERYASNFDNSVFAPSDSGVIANGDTDTVAGNVLVFHSSAPRQMFL